jgi:hypothetical protein
MALIGAMMIRASPRAAGDDRETAAVLGNDRLDVGGQPDAVILNLPLIGMWIKLLTVPYRILYPSILLFMAIGVFSISTSLSTVS